MLGVGTIPSCVHFARKLGANWGQKGYPGDDEQERKREDLTKVEE
jgi:hypothetical protein